jgi:hypothetical protein
MNYFLSTKDFFAAFEGIFLFHCSKLTKNMSAYVRLFSQEKKRAGRASIQPKRITAIKAITRRTGRNSLFF